MRKNVLILFVSMMLCSAATFAQTKASYYANFFHGRKTSSGAIYHRDSLTCAHRTLPFGTLLKVRNLQNNKEVIVKVNDRGPFVMSREIDLSYAAAKKIGILHCGIGQVEITHLKSHKIIRTKPQPKKVEPVEEEEDIIVPFRPEYDYIIPFDDMEMEAFDAEIPAFSDKDLSMMVWARY